MDAGTLVSDGLESWPTPTADPAWQFVEDSYDPAREAEIEAWFAIGNGLLGVRASRAISRGATWVTYQHHSQWGLGEDLCRRSIRYAECAAAGARPSPRTRLAAAAYLDR